MDSRSKRLLILTLILIAGAVAFGYYRFFVTGRYVLQYEVSCDPISEECFVARCEDAGEEDCVEDRYYKLMQKYASDVKRSCGDDVRDCPAAARCSDTDEVCIVEYCDATVEDGQCDAVSMPE
jgi:hypothetical protein